MRAEGIAAKFVLLAVLLCACERRASSEPPGVDASTVFTEDVEMQIRDGDFVSLTAERVGDVPIAPPEAAAASVVFFLQEFGRMHLPRWREVVGRELRIERLHPCFAPALALPFATGLTETASTLARIEFGPVYMVRVCERGRHDPVAIVRVPAEAEFLALRQNNDSLTTYAGVLFVAAPLPAGAVTAVDPIEAAALAARETGARVKAIPVLQSRPWVESAFRGDWRLVLDGQRRFRTEAGGVLVADTVYVGLGERGERTLFGLLSGPSDSEGTVVIPDPDGRSERPDLVLRIGRHGTKAKSRLAEKLP